MLSSLTGLPIHLVKQKAPPARMEKIRRLRSPFSWGCSDHHGDQLFTLEQVGDAKVRPVRRFRQKLDRFHVDSPNTAPALVQSFVGLSD
jgi:hypothetical protein